MEKKLKDWYVGINEEDILPNGIIKINTPTMDTDNQAPDTAIAAPSFQEKNKSISLRAFILANKIQDGLIKLSEFENKDEKDSEEKQKISDSIKKTYKELGEEIDFLWS